MINEVLEAPFGREEDPIFFSPSHLPPKKAPGPDEIPNSSLRHLPRQTIALTRLFNAILRSGYFARQWRGGRIFLLPKPMKDPTKPDSYPTGQLLCYQPLPKCLRHSYCQSSRNTLHPAQNNLVFAPDTPPACSFQESSTSWLRQQTRRNAQ